MNRGLSRDDIDEIVQRSMLECSFAIQRHDPNLSDLQSFLISRAYNAMKDHIRGTRGIYKRAATIHSIDALAQPIFGKSYNHTAKLEFEELLKVLEKCFRRYKTVFKAIVIDRLTQREAAEVTGLSESRIGQIVRESKHHFETYLAKEERNAFQQK